MMPVTIRIRYFGPAREATGIEEEEMELTGGTSVADVRSALAERHPGLSRLVGASRFAVNAAYAADGDPVPDGAEVALIPPVAGG